MPVIRVKSGPDAGRICSLGKEKVVIGRDKGADIRLEDQGVSRRHAEITKVGELYILRDCGSRNGTFINDEKINERVLREGDKIKVGSTVLVFEDPPGSTLDALGLQFAEMALNPSETMCLSSTVSSELKEKFPKVRESALLSVLEKVAKEVVSPVSVRKMADRVASILGKSVGAESVYVFRLIEREGREEFHLVGSWAPQQHKAPFKISRTVLSHVSKEGTGLLVNNLGMDQRFSGRDSIIAQRLQSVLCVPLKVRGKTFGLIYAANSIEGKGFTAEGLELFAAAASQLGLAIAFQNALRRSETFFKEAMEIVVSAFEHRMPHKRGEARRVADLCGAIARALHLEPQDIRNAWLSGLFHDIAILGLSDAELSEPSLFVLRRNKAAEALLGGLPQLRPVLEAIVNQDERYDGTGQPQGKKGDEIPLLAQILALAKELDRLVVGEISTGGEHSAREAVQKIHGARGKAFSPQVVDAAVVAYRRGELFQQEKPTSVFGS